MKPLSIVCASFLALAALTVTATAATSVNSSKSNSDLRIDPNDPKAVKACTDGGGTVTKDAAGNPVCRKPTPQPQTDQQPSGY